MGNNKRPAQAEMALAYMKERYEGNKKRHESV